MQGLAGANPGVGGEHSVPQPLPAPWLRDAGLQPRSPAEAVPGAGWAAGAPAGLWFPAVPVAAALLGAPGAGLWDLLAAEMRSIIVFYCGF